MFQIAFSRTPTDADREILRNTVDFVSFSYYSSLCETADPAKKAGQGGNIFGGADLNWSRIVPGSIRLVLEDKAPVLRSDGKHPGDCGSASLQRLMPRA